MGKKHRPIDQRILETQAQLAQLMAKQAKDEIATNPQIQELDMEIKDLNAEMVKMNRWESEAEEKVENFMRRADEWRTKGQSAKGAKPSILQSLAEVKSKRKALAEQLASTIELNTGDME
jgi:chromosome segregation ATPase